MTSKPSLGLQHFLLVLFLLICFGGIFYTYNKPAASWLLFPNVPVSMHGACTEECISELMVNFSQSINNIRTLNYTLVKKQPPTTKPAVTEENEENKENHDFNIRILVWSWPFGYKFDVKGCATQYGVKGCDITDDRSQYEKAHGVMFHLRDIGGDYVTLQNKPRPPHQKWVWMNMESPDNSPRHAELNDVFNLTANYRRDSDIWVPYGRVVEASETNKTFKIPPKDKLICWVVSHWNPNFRRVKFFNELINHIKVEAYGRHFGRYVNDEDFSKILQSCKFYLSFENSIFKDYISEKLYNPLILGTVPVVLGPPRENYEEFVPADSFIHVDDFKSPQELAERLTFLDQNQEAYERYFAWRQHFTAKMSGFGLEHACRICDHIRNHKGYRVFKNLNTWYWG